MDSYNNYLGNGVYVVLHDRANRQDAAVVAIFDVRREAVDFVCSQEESELFGCYSRHTLAKTFPKYKKTKAGNAETEKDLKASEYFYAPNLP